MLHIAGPAASVRSAQPGDRSTLYNLLHYELHSHRHMDWRPPLDWVGQEPFLVAEKLGMPAALLACPPEPPEVAWIRAFAASSLVDLRSTWDLLWERAKDALRQAPQAERALALVMDDWFLELLRSSRFHRLTSVIMLSWENSARRLAPPRTDVLVRPMLERDLPEVAVLDRAAFQPVWHSSIETLRIAYAQAVLATVSEQDGHITGYQISTPSPLGGHLARLAVLPDLQGRGIGYALLHDLLQRFQARGALRVTVNTQDDNLASQRLYQRAQFHLTGESYPVFVYNL